MSGPCCAPASRDAPAAFSCHGCGNCCTDLHGRGESARPRFASLPGTGIYRLPTPGGLRLFAWEAGPFRQHELEPLLAVADASRGRLVALAYELVAHRCPQYDDERACTIYADRPLVCRSFPLLVVDAGEGIEVAASDHCPARVPVVGAVKVSSHPEHVLAALYPNEAAAALAVPVLVRHLAELVEYLEHADVLAAARGLGEPELAEWRTRGVLDVVDVAEGAGVLTGDVLRDRARGTVAGIAARWAALEPSA